MNCFDILDIQGLGKLSEGDKNFIEGKLTFEECKKALDKMTNGESPGCDGLTVDFY